MKVLYFCVYTIFHWADIIENVLSKTKGGGGGGGEKKKKKGGGGQNGGGGGAGGKKDQNREEWPYWGPVGVSIEGDIQTFCIL